MLHATRRLIALRKAHPALGRGDMRLLDGPEGVVCFERVLGDERLMCAFNLGHAAAAWTAPSGWRLVESVNLPAGSAGTLPPMAGVVLEQG